MAYLHNSVTRYCAICYSSQDSVTLVSLPCSCTSCSACLTSWISVQSQELHYQTKEEIHCINSECKHSFQPQEIFLQLNSNQQETISNLLLTVYVKKTLDIRSCPNTNCKYAGIIDLNACCQEYLQCKNCETKWREKIHLENGNSDNGIYVRQKFNLGEILSQIREEICTRKCPHCNVSIQKNGGCDHITCGKCSHEFCWICSQDHNSHSVKHCKISSFTKILFTIMISFYLFGITGFSQGILTCVEGTFISILNATLLNTGFILMIVLYDLMQRRKIAGTVITVILIALIGTIIFLWEIHINMAKIAIVEAIILSSIRVFRVNLREWIKCVK